MAELLLGARVESGEPLAAESEDLTTHGVIVGMTGSGKTGLGIVLLEEARRAVLRDSVGDVDTCAGP